MKVLVKQVQMKVCQTPGRTSRFRTQKSMTTVCSCDVLIFGTLENFTINPDT